LKSHPWPRKYIMLQEVRNVRQVPGEPQRRWFSQSGLDLIVWLNKDKSVHGFQLCYQKDAEERAITWTSDQGFSHKRIDDGEGRPSRYKMTPILVPDGTFDKPSVISLFEASAQQLDSDIVAFVSRTLATYPESRKE
jgi:hypothetical protein